MACVRVVALERAGEESLFLFYSLLVGLQGRRTSQGGWLRKAVGRAWVGARRILRSGARRPKALAGLSPRPAGIHAELGDTYGYW